MDEVAALKQVQAGLNASFEAIYAAKDAKSVASAKEELVGLGYAAAGLAMGPAFTLINLAGTPVHYMAIRIALDLNLFEIIADKPRTLDELVQITNADRELLKRIVRLVNAIGWLKQTDFDKWEATPMTHTVNIPTYRNWMIVQFDTQVPMYAKFPEWLRKHQHKTSWVDEKDNIWTQVNGGNFWSYMAENPSYSKLFDSAMSISDRFPPEMTPPYPFSSEINNIETSPDAVTLVDVGGGVGQAIASIKKAYPSLSGRFVLQDLPKSIETLHPSTAQDIGFELMVHDFFQLQPVKQAKYYHLRRILHDWNDEKCLEILLALHPAMDPTYSKLLIVDIVLADVNPGPFEALADLMMMTTLNGKERTTSEWHALLDKAGFKIDQILRADSGATCVIEASVA